jgi:hypothetical protein
LIKTPPLFPLDLIKTPPRPRSYPQARKRHHSMMGSE